AIGSVALSSDTSERRPGLGKVGAASACEGSGLARSSLVSSHSASSGLVGSSKSAMAGGDRGARPSRVGSRGRGGGRSLPARAVSASASLASARDPSLAIEAPFGAVSVLMAAPYEGRAMTKKGMRAQGGGQTVWSQLNPVGQGGGKNCPRAPD